MEFQALWLRVSIWTRFWLTWSRKAFVLPDRVMVVKGWRGGAGPRYCYADVSLGQWLDAA